MRHQSTIKTSDGITWYYEQEGTGPDIVLVPDGIGECGMFDNSISQIAAAGFRVTTMDMPGMSRSSDAPKETYTEVTAQKLARYVIGLMDALKIDVASVWGCSSGGATVLALLIDYPSRIRNAMAHEVPTLYGANLTATLPVDEDDETILRNIKPFLSQMHGSEEKWQALGAEIHARLQKNYITWTRGYPRTIPPSSPVKTLEALPNHKWALDWTLGAETPTGAFYDNALTAGRIGVNLTTLPGRHQPYVSHPDAFAKYVMDTTRKYV